MSQQRGYPGGNQGGYGDVYGQGDYGRRPKVNNPESQGYGESSDPFYGANQYDNQPPLIQSQQDYQYPAGDQYNDPQYYQGQDDRHQSSYQQFGYEDDQSYYQGGTQYHQQDYYRGEKNQPQKQYPKSNKKPNVYQKPKRYPEDQSSFGNKGVHSYPQKPKHSGSFKDGFSGSHHGHSQGGTSQKGKAGQDKIQSERKGSDLQESTAHHMQSSGQGATKPAFGEYYSQKRYIQEQDRGAKKEQKVTSLAEADLSEYGDNPKRPVTIGQVHLASGSKKLRLDQTATLETIGSRVIQTKIEDDRFSKTMAKFNTLDRGTYFVREENKCAHFMNSGRDDILGWKDTYVINGYLLHGVIIKILTLTSRIFLFVENLHSIYKKFIKIDEDGETVSWTDQMPDSQQIVTIKSIEKVEVLDNDEEGFEGFVCYTICEDSTMEFNSKPSNIADWKYVQQLILMYEPTSIRKIYLDVVYNSIYKPESKGFGGKRIAAIVNPHVPGETIQYSEKIVTALEKQCVVGTIWIQNGRYTLIAETAENMERLIKLVDLALEIAEELNAYVMITNLRRTFDYSGKTILYINSDPTLKLIRSSNQIPFASKIKKSENLT